MCALTQPWLRAKHSNSNIGVDRESLFQGLARMARAQKAVNRHVSSLGMNRAVEKNHHAGS